MSTPTSRTTPVEHRSPVLRPDKTNNGGETPFSHAIVNGHDEVVTLLDLWEPAPTSRKK